MVWPCQCTFQSPFSISQCGNGWYFGLGGLILLVGLSNFWALFWWLHFLARDWNVHLIVSHVVGAIVGVS